MYLLTIFRWEVVQVEWQARLGTFLPQYRTKFSSIPQMDSPCPVLFFSTASSTWYVSQFCISSCRKPRDEPLQKLRTTTQASKALMINLLTSQNDTHLKTKKINKKLKFFVPKLFSQLDYTISSKILSGKILTY